MDRKIAMENIKNVKGYTKDIVKTILSRPNEFEWSIQGLGMLRLYLTDKIRLHVWSTQHAVPSVSELHNHPWHFTSTIIAGCMANVRYKELKVGNAEWYTEWYYKQNLHCGPEGGLVGEPNLVRLRELRREIYQEGESYVQNADEIHASRPFNGTVSVIERTVESDPDHASVFWPQKLGETGFVSAKPRMATKEEVKAITKNALSRWF